MKFASLNAVINKAVMFNQIKKLITMKVLNKKVKDEQKLLLVFHSASLF